MDRQPSWEWASFRWWRWCDSKDTWGREWEKEKKKKKKFICPQSRFGIECTWKTVSSLRKKDKSHMIILFLRPTIVRRHPFFIILSNRPIYRSSSLCHPSYTTIYTTTTQANLAVAQTVYLEEDTDLERRWRSRWSRSWEALRVPQRGVSSRLSQDWFPWRSSRICPFEKKNNIIHSIAVTCMKGMIYSHKCGRKKDHANLLHLKIVIFEG